MIGKPLDKEEEANAPLVLALSGALMLLAVKRDGPLSLGWVVARGLSNPVPVQGAAGTRSDTFGPDPDQRIAA